MAKAPDLEHLARVSGRFRAEAFDLVGQGLRRAAELHGKQRALGAERHLRAAQLIDGVIEVAAERYGLLAELVLRAWGISDADDLGEITFILIAHDVFSKQPDDRLEDFNGQPPLSAGITASVRRRLGLT